MPPQIAKGLEPLHIVSFDSQGGGSLGVLPLGDVGRMEQSLPLLHAHSGGLSFKQTGAFNLFFSVMWLFWNFSFYFKTYINKLSCSILTLYNTQFQLQGEKIYIFLIKNLKNLKRLSYPFTCTFKV